MLIVLDKSLSMAQSGKWTAAQLAIVQAIDTDAFDNMALGLMVYPARNRAATGLPGSDLAVSDLLWRFGVAAGFR